MANDTTHTSGPWRTSRTDLESYAVNHAGDRVYPYVASHVVWGMPFRLNINSARDESWYGERDWADWGESLRNIVHPGDVVFDCGANVGFMSMLFARRGAKKVVAFEPNAANAEALRANAELNGVGGTIAVEQAAVASRACRLRFDGECVGRGRRGVPVRGVVLDDYLVHGPTAIKIDVEGYELEVLRGATRLLKTRPRMEIEMHLDPSGRGVDMRRDYGFSPREILTILFDNGYRVYRAVTESGGANEIVRVEEIDSFVHAGIYCL